MKVKKITICMLTVVALLAAGCSNGAQDPALQVPDQETTGTADADEVAQETTQVVEMDHFRLKVDSQWSVEKGADSVAFKSGEQSIGGVDGLGYADSVESLVPNHSIIKEQKELQGMAAKAVEVITTTDSTDSTESEAAAETMHIFLFLEEQKVVYDIRFDSSAVDEQQAIDIVKSAEIK